VEDIDQVAVRLDVGKAVESLVAVHKAADMLVEGAVLAEECMAVDTAAAEEHHTDVDMKAGEMEVVDTAVVVGFRKVAE
jgi:hypothetical protein